jgi:hypothetical protein
MMPSSSRWVKERGAPAFYSVWLQRYGRGQSIFHAAANQSLEIIFSSNNISLDDPLFTNGLDIEKKVHFTATMAKIWQVSR